MGRYSRPETYVLTACHNFCTETDRILIYPSGFLAVDGRAESDTFDEALQRIEEVRSRQREWPERTVASAYEVLVGQEREGRNSTFLDPKALRMPPSKALDLLAALAKAETELIAATSWQTTFDGTSTSLTTQNNSRTLVDACPARALK